MEWRTKLGALLGAGGLLLLAASTVFAVPPGGPPGGGPPSSPPGGGPPASHPGGGPPTSAPTTVPTILPSVDPSVAPSVAPTSNGGGGGGGGPTYFIDVTKTADPAVVPPAGGDVEYTVWVENTGTGFFQTVVIDDGMTGCTLTGPTGGDSDDKLEAGETWAYTCTVSDVTPGTENTATVNACHDLSDCASVHDATDQGSVTVGTGSATEAPPTEAPPTEAPPTEAPPVSDPPGGTFDPGGEVLGATQPTTDADVGALVGGPTNSLMLVIALGMLLASLVLVTPARPVRQR